MFRSCNIKTSIRMQRLNSCWSVPTSKFTLLFMCNVILTTLAIPRKRYKIFSAKLFTDKVHSINYKILNTNFTNMAIFGNVVNRKPARSPSTFFPIDFSTIDFIDNEISCRACVIFLFILNVLVHCFGGSEHFIDCSWFCFVLLWQNEEHFIQRFHSEVGFHSVFSVFLLDLFWCFFFLMTI